MYEKLSVANVGPIKLADVTFGDMTVLVGPQATGKSLFLQYFRLTEDLGYVQDQLLKYGIDWGQDPKHFLAAYLGEGLETTWQEGSSLRKNGQPFKLEDKVRRKQRSKEPAVFFIPSQRVVTLGDGWPRRFQSFGGTDPCSLRDFSETLRQLMEQWKGEDPKIFPRTKKFNSEYGELLSDCLFRSFELAIDRYGFQKRLVLRKSEGPSIGYMAWSAGQRESVPLLLALDWLMPPAATDRRSPIQWVIIEEPEMGLHPKAISAILLLVMELLYRRYRVIVSTHSLHVLDVVWAIQRVTKPQEVLEIFNVRQTQALIRMSAEILKKSFLVYYFAPEGTTADISSLDACSESREEAGWGGLTEFTGKINDIVARAVSRQELASKPE
jgi:hypothetical protein